MPAYTTFSNTGAATNRTDIDVAAATSSSAPTIANYVMHNKSGNAMSMVWFLPTGSAANAFTMVITRASGASETHDGTTNLTLNADETIFMTATNTDATGTRSWRPASFQTAHGTPLTAGHGHTSLSTGTTPGVYVGAV